MRSCCEAQGTISSHCDRIWWRMMWEKVCVCVCVCMRLGPFNVQQKLTEHCKPTIIKNNKNLKKTIISEAYFLSFSDTKTTTKWQKLPTWWPWALQPWTYQNLRTHVTPPFLLTINQSELCTSRSHVLGCPSLIWPLKILFSGVLVVGKESDWHPWGPRFYPWPCSVG